MGSFAVLSNPGLSQSDLANAHVWTAPQTVSVTDGSTNQLASELTLQHSSTGVPAANFGNVVNLQADSATVAGQRQAQIKTFWISAVDATRTSKMTFSVADFAGTRQALELGCDGTQALIGLYGVAGVARAAAIATPNAQTAAYVQADVQSLKTAIDLIRVALQSIGIIL